VHLFAELDGIICVFDGFETHQFAAFSRFVDVLPVDAAGYDFVVSLQEDATVAEVVKEGVHRRADVEGVEPEGEYASFALAFGVEVFNLEFFFFGDGVEAWVVVEEVGHEGEVEFGVTGYERSGRQEFAAVKFIGILEDLFGSLVEIARLKGRPAADIGGQLIEEDSVVVALLNIGGEI